MNFRFKSLLILVFLLIIVMTSSSVLANYSGPSYAGTGTSVTAGVGTQTWLNPTGISADDASYTTVGLKQDQISDYLQATNFGFNIPEDATISGIQVEIDRYASNFIGNTRIRDENVRLVKAGTIVGDNKADTGSYWPLSGTNKSYGAGNELWGAEWTPAEINATDFGAALSVKNLSTLGISYTAYVDYIRITVTYTNAVNLAADQIEAPYGETISLTAMLTMASDDSVIKDKQIDFYLNDVLACNASTDDYGIASCPTTLLVDAGTYPNGVKAVFSGDVDFTPITSFADLIVNKKEITVTGITAEDKIYDGTTTALLNTEAVTLVGVVGSEVVELDVENIAGAFIDANVAVGKVVNVSGLQLSGDEDVLTNYILINPTATASITKKAASVTPDTVNKVYGDPDLTLTGILTGFLDIDGVTATYLRAAGETVAGSPYSISAVLSSVDVLDNYDITFNTADFSIQTRPITVTADDKTKTIGTDDPEMTYSITAGSLVFPDELSGQLTRDAGETVGDYVIKQGTLSASDNYLMTFEAGTLTITPLPTVTVTVDENQSKVYGDADPVFTYTSDPELEFSGVLERVVGENAGTYAVYRGSLAAEGYEINFVPANFTITKKTASVTPDAKSKIIGDPDPLLTGTLSGFLMADAVTASYVRTTGEMEGTYVISATISPIGVLGNYDISYTTADFTIMKKPGFNLFLPLIVK